ncbi:MAG: MIP/aquaporin family protein [Albidovulum sp.]
MIRRLSAEALGTAFLLIAVVGSGIMAETLSGGNTGLALLANALATGCALYVLITVLGPISGAHFNPVVTLVFASMRKITPCAALAYIAVQTASGIAGVWLAHAMFGFEIWQVSATARTGSPQWLAEVVATFGLLFTILGGLRHAPGQVPVLVGAYITGAYWFTASTSFANPAVTIARALSDTFAGIDPAHVTGFIFAQLAGAVIAIIFLPRLFSD